MTWQKGQSGNPTGNRNAKGRPMSGTTWVDIFEAIMDGREKEYPNSPKKQIIKKALSAARAGKAWAIKFLMNHGLGMPVQKNIIGQDEDNEFIIRHKYGENDDIEVGNAEDKARDTGSSDVVSSDTED